MLEAETILAFSAFAARWRDNARPPEFLTNRRVRQNNVVLMASGGRLFQEFLLYWPVLRLSCDATPSCPQFANIQAACRVPPTRSTSWE